MAFLPGIVLGSGLVPQRTKKRYLLCKEVKNTKTHTTLLGINKRFYERANCVTMVSDTYTKMFKALHPKNITEYAKASEGTVQDGIKVYVLAWFITLILGIIGFFVVGDEIAGATEISNLTGMAFVGALGVVTVILVSVVTLIIGIIMNYVTQYAGALCATSVFKGTGKFEKQFYIAMLFTGAIIIISSVIGFVDAFIPGFMLVGGIIMLLIGIWSIYLLYLTIREVHKIDLVGGLISMLVVFIVSFAIAFVIMLILGLIGIGALAAGALGGAAATGGLENIGM